MSHITAKNIDSWSDQIESRHLLPVLIRKLIHETCQPTQIEEIDFPSNTDMSGYDGVLTVKSSAGPRVPEGKSVWELSTSQNVNNKANEDFDKRNAAPGNIDQAATTYVGVSARNFSGKNDWKFEKSKSCRWKDVRFIDANDIEQWLETSLGTQLWFATQVGHPVSFSGVSLLEWHWDGVSKMPRKGIIIHPDMFLSNRNDVAEYIKNWLEGKPKIESLQANSDGEALDFLAAILYKMDDNQREHYLSKILVIDSDADWNNLVRRQENLIFILKPHATSKFDTQVFCARDKHHVLRIAPAFRQSGGQTAWTLPRLIPSELSFTLQNAGYSSVEAKQIAEQTGGSGTQLRNSILECPPVCEPQERSDSLRPFVWIGGWSRSSPGDKEIVSQIVGNQDYQQLEFVVLQENQRPDSLFYVDSEIVSLYSKTQAWGLFAGTVSEAEFDSFLQIAVDVLSESNPVYDIPENEQFYAGINGTSPQYSSFLKKNIAETLACIAALSAREAIVLCGIKKIQIQQKVDDAVRKILDTVQNTNQWMSLGRVLTSLAEASPSIFCAIVKRELDKGTDSCFIDLMNDGATSPMFGKCNHANLLWAIETLAYSQDYYADAIEMLVRLQKIDTGGRWGNRPNSSLEMIYCPWYLVSDISLETRIKVLDHLFISCEQDVWNLVYKMSFETPSIASPPHLPTWRDWGLESPLRMDNSVRVQMLYECSKRAIEHLNENTERWKMVVGGINCISRTEVYNALMDKITLLCQCIPSEWTETQKADLACVIDKVSARNNDGTPLAIAGLTTHIELFQQLKNKLTENDSVGRSVWWFSWDAELSTVQIEQNDVFQISCTTESTSPTAELVVSTPEMLTQRRKEALAQIIENHGIDGILRLVRQVEQHTEIRPLLDDSVAWELCDKAIPNLLTSANDKEVVFAMSLIARCFTGRHEYETSLYTRNPERFDITKWVPLATVRFFQSCRESQESWNWLCEFPEDVQKEYWTRHSGRMQNTEEERQKPENIRFLLKKFKQYKNVHATLTLILRKHGETCLTITELLSVLEFAAENEEVLSDLSRGGWSITDVFELIQSKCKSEQMLESDITRLAKMELVFIKYLYSSYTKYKPDTLETFLCVAPDTFIEILKILFNPNEEEITHLADHYQPENNQKYDNAQANATALYSLLHQWKKLPGTQDDGTIDVPQLKKWILQSRELARVCARLGMCDYNIGELLARNCPEILSGQLPPPHIMDAIEELNTESLNEGFSIGIVNNQGVTTRSCFDGGNLEREIAGHFTTMFEKIRQSHPRAAVVFKNLEEQYTLRAGWEDEQAERRKFT